MIKLFDMIKGKKEAPATLARPIPIQKELPKATKVSERLLEMKNAKIKETMDKLDTARNQANLKDQGEIFDYYYQLSLQYAKERVEYNQYSYKMTNKERQKAYQNLIYTQGCIKALEYTLNITYAKEVKNG